MDVINDYNNEPLDKFGGMSRIEMCAKSYNPQCREVDELSRLMLFGLERAKKPILQAKAALLCEGQIDVIACHEAGHVEKIRNQRYLSIRRSD
jgi:hypothetical protein